MIKRINIRPYNGTLYIITTREEFKMMRDQRTDVPIDLELCDGIASDFDNKLSHLVGVFNHDEPLKVLIHELGHVCIKVFDGVGMEINQTTSEAFCYLIEDLMRECLEVFETVPLKM